MFAFDDWAAWLKSQAETLDRDGFSCAYQDTRNVTECALNPSFGIDVDTPKSIGSLRYWKVGTCDYQVADKATGDLTANETMLDANDLTVPVHFSRFKFFLEGQQR